MATQHEEQSIKMFEHLIAENNIREYMKKKEYHQLEEEDGLREEDERFIKALIRGLETDKVAVSY